METAIIYYGNDRHEPKLDLNSVHPIVRDASGGGGLVAEWTFIGKSLHNLLLFRVVWVRVFGVKG